ncbi:MAG: hypothetical protein AAF471_01855 [Myxococcota bacterium]
MMRMSYRIQPSARQKQHRWVNRSQAPQKGNFDQEVMRHFRASVRENRVLAELLAR